MVDSSAQRRPREAQETVPWKVAKTPMVWNFVGTDTSVLVSAQIEPGDLALNDTGDFYFYTGAAWVQLDSSAHVALTLDVNADTLLSLSTQELGLDTQTANLIFAGPSSGAAAVPTFRSMVDADIPASIARDSELHTEDHDHDGSPTQQLLAANTHQSVSADTHHAGFIALEDNAGTVVSPAGDDRIQFTDDGVINADASGNTIALSIAQASIDHGTIGGTSDDDHTQYILVAGTRAFTGNQSFGDFNITNVGDISLDSISADGTLITFTNDARFTGAVSGSTIAEAHVRIGVDTSPRIIFDTVSEESLFVDYFSDQLRISVTDPSVVVLFALNQPSGDLQIAGSFSMIEKAAAIVDTAGEGQFWVKNDAPNTPQFTDDLGNDRALIWSGGAFHDGFSDFVANEHIDHTSVTLTAGVGLSGGGDISTSRTFTVDLNELTTETTIAAGDFIAMVDITDSGSGKITFANFEGALNHDSLTGFVTDEHIAHSGVTLTAGVGLSGGGDISASRTFTVDLNELTTETSPDATVDFVAMIDATDSGSGKVLMGQIPPGYPTETTIASGDLVTFVDISETPDAANKITFANFEGALNHDSLTGFVLAEHVTEASIDHGTIAGTGDDDHTQYALLAGRASSQTLIGGTAANEDLVLQATANATRTTSTVQLFVDTNATMELAATKQAFGSAIVTVEFLATTVNFVGPASLAILEFNASGVEITRDLFLVKSAASITFDDTGETDPAGEFRLLNDADSLQFQGRNAADSGWENMTVWKRPNTTAAAAIETVALVDDFDNRKYIGIGAADFTVDNADVPISGQYVFAKLTQGADNAGINRVTYTFTGIATVIPTSYDAGIIIDYNTEQTALANYSTFRSNVLWRNSGSVTMFGWISGFRSDVGFTVDGGTLTVDDIIGFWSQPRLEQTSEPTALTIETVAGYATWHGFVFGVDYFIAGNTTVDELIHYHASDPSKDPNGQDIIGTGVTLTDHYGFVFDDHNDGTNIIGFKSRLLAGAAQWSMQMGAAQSYHEGNLHLGGTAVPTARLEIDNTTDQYALDVNSNVSAASQAAALIKQEHASGAVPVLELSQDDIDDTFINYIGTSAADGSRSISSDTTEDGAKFGAFRVEINGVTKWVRIYDDHS